VGTQSYSIFKTALLASALALFVACSSTGDATGDEQQAAAGAGDAGSSGGAAGAGSSGSSVQIGGTGAGETAPLTQEQAEREEALRTTVFYFDFDVAEFRADDRPTLAHHARDLAASPDRRIRLEGHADERGTREYNLALGERRANGILNYLIVNGASREQIQVVSYGEERPAEMGESEQAYAANRRVEIVE